MIIKHLKITGLYGFLDKDIEFNERINLLVGINGSGKTSIMSVLNWVLKPDFVELSVNEFELIELDFVHEQKNVTIRCEKGGKNLRYRVISDGTEYTPINVDLDERLRSYTRYGRRRRDEVRETYESMSPEDHEKAAWDFVHNLPNPISITLDRLLYVKNSKGSVFSDRSSRYQYIDYEDRHRNDRTAIDTVYSIFQKSYNDYRNKLSDLDSRLRNQLILSLFDPNTLESDFNDNKIGRALNDQSLKDLERSVNKYLKSSVFKNNNDLSAVKTYFTTIRDIMKKRQKSKKEVDSLESLGYQFDKLIKLVSEFNKYEKEAVDLEKDIKKFLFVVNSLFQDSNKVLKVNEVSGRLYAEVIDRNKDIRLEDLSSGEQQILTLLTYITFGAEQDSFFIIDEPEISLHPKWQEDFIKSVEELQGEETQILIATHSPAIVGMHRKYCIPLYPISTKIG